MKPGNRSLFPRLGWRAYLNHAAIGPLATPTRAAVDAALDLQAVQGVGGFGELIEFGELVCGELIESVNSSMRG